MIINYNYASTGVVGTAGVFFQMFYENIANLYYKDKHVTGIWAKGSS